jgi:hypothetical protein
MMTRKNVKKVRDAWARRDKLYAEGAKLYAEGNKLRAEGDLVFNNAVISVYGNVVMKWTTDGCVICGDKYTG